MFNYRISLLLIFVVTYSTALAQQRPQQNVRRVTVTSQYLLENGNKTDKYWVVYQEMYDSLGRLHTEVDWNFNTHKPNGFILHDYNGKMRVKTQKFTNNMLQTINIFTYTKDSLVQQEIITLVKPGDTSKYLTLKYIYNKFKSPQQIEAFTSSGKIAYKSTYAYDSKGGLLSLKVKIKKNIIPLDSIIYISNTPLYDSVGRIIRCQNITQKFGKNKEISFFEYSYDKKNRPIEIKVKNSQGDLVSREERIYDQNRNRIQQIKLYNKTNTLIKWIVKRYEIYNSNNQTYRVIDY